MPGTCLESNQEAEGMPGTGAPGSRGCQRRRGHGHRGPFARPLTEELGSDRPRVAVRHQQHTTLAVLQFIPLAGFIPLSGVGLTG